MLKIAQINLDMQHVLRYRDGAAGSGSRKPRGATQLQLFSYVGNGADPRPRRRQTLRMLHPLAVHHPVLPQRRRQARHLLCAVGLRRGQFSAFSLPVSMLIAGWLAPAAA